MSSAFDDLLDRMAMHELGSRGQTQAHLFLQDRLSHPLKDVKTLKYLGRREPIRVFIPSKEEDRVALFSDGSGVYVFSDGFCTPMGNDIRHEVDQWEEVL